MHIEGLGFYRLMLWQATRAKIEALEWLGVRLKLPNPGPE